MNYFPTSNAFVVWFMSDICDPYANHQGEFKVQEDKKHRKKYESLGDSEKKLQFFSARQIACRLLGSRGYLCQKVCWALNHGNIACNFSICWVFTVEHSLYLKLSKFITIADKLRLSFLSSAGFPWKTVCVQELCHVLFGTVYGSGCICIQRFYFLCFFRPRFLIMSGVDHQS